MTYLQGSGLEIAGGELAGVDVLRPRGLRCAETAQGANVANAAVKSLEWERSVPAVGLSAALSLLGRSQLVRHARHLQFDGQASEQSGLVRAQLGHGTGFVVVDRARREFENLRRFMHGAAQAGQADDFFFPRCKL